MKSCSPSAPGGVRWPFKIFRLLLLAYPRSFRDEFGLEIEQTFADIYQDVGAGSSHKHIAHCRLWINTLVDLAVSALLERGEEMNKTRLALLIVAAAIGFLIAYVDSRPHWDDSGITVCALLLTSFLLGAISPSRPWAWALAIGVWIPLAGVLFRHDVSMLITLAFPLIGAYAGSFVRRLLTGFLTTA